MGERNVSRRRDDAHAQRTGRRVQLGIEVKIEDEAIWLTQALITAGFFNPVKALALTEGMN